LYFGVNSSKGNLVKRDCELINFMEGVLKKIQGDLATDYILKHESTIQVKEEQQKQAEKKEEKKKKQNPKEVKELIRQSSEFEKKNYLILIK